MKNEYTNWERTEERFRPKPPERGSPQFERRAAQKFLKWMVRHPDANNQKILKEEAEKCRSDAPFYWKDVCEKQFRLKWQQNENRKAKLRAEREKEQVRND